MNKKLKGLIALSLVTANMLLAGGEHNMFITTAYASCDDACEISELDIEDDDGDTIDLYEDDDYEDEVDDDLDEGETYYAESSTKKITIDTGDVDDDYVKIFANDSEYDLGDDIKLKDGTNTIKIRVYEDEYDEDDSYSSSDYNQYTVKVEYDDEDDDDSDDELTDLDIEDSEGYSIDLYSDSDYEDELDDDLEEGETYYAESTTSKIIIDNDDVDADYVRIIYGSSVYELGDSIKLSSGTNTIKIMVYDDEYDEDESYTSADYTQYTLKIKYDSDSDDSTDSSELSLSSLSLSNGSLSYSKNITSYNVVISSNINSINNEAIPADSDYTVEINNDEVSESDYYSKTISLTDYSTPVTIKVSNDDQYKIYTVNLTKSVNENNSGNINTPYTQTGNINSSSQSNNIQQGTIPSANSGISSATGWGYLNNSWYYTYSDGTKAAGWLLTGGKWYYLDNSGKMLTGWFRDNDGKWYYLYESGEMALNTTIDGFKLGQSGAWIQ